MDVTNFIVSRRNNALLVGDYGSYRQQLSRRLLTVRKKLGRATLKGRKYTPKAPVTVEDITSNHEFAHLILLTSERAWAHAMYMKSMHSADSADTAISGSTRSHIISRLSKAGANAANLVQLLKEEGQRQFPLQVLLEAQAYHGMLRGTLEFEAQRWENCLEAYSEVHTIYTSLEKHSSSNSGDIFRELLSSTVDQSIRFAAYKLKIPRTTSIPRIVSKYLRKNSEAIQVLLKVDQYALDTEVAGTKEDKGANTRDLPKTINWRTRTVNIEDANIAQALAAVSAAEAKLAHFLSSPSSSHSRDLATAYDDVLIPSQDAVDATKTAIDELTADGVAPGDQRMQSLQITRTAVNYALVGWRIGRNRVLCGKEDGASLEPEASKSKKSKTQESEVQNEPKDESDGRKLSRLRERIVLYDSMLQSLDSVKELPGVAADQQLHAELQSKRAYFASLRCLAIARSHSLLGNSRNALALFARALTLSSEVSSTDSHTSTNKPSSLEVTSEQARGLKSLLQGLVTQQRALVEIENLSSEAAASVSASTKGTIPLIERLDEYPLDGVDFSNLVTYPPKLKPIPVKPIFLDVAWNYIDYPGRAAEPSAAAVSARAPAAKKETVQETKKGWFGFGR